MKAIIIAAGLGSRLGSISQEKPKCLLEVAGSTILANTIHLLRKENIEDIAIIVGHQANKIQVENVKYFSNPNYKNNNILHSLMYAKSFMDDDMIITYSDIWIEESLIEQIARRPEDLIVSVDTQWEELYVGRTDHPIAQAENAVFDDQGVLYEIGKHIDSYTIKPGLHCGEFIGLFKMSKQFCQTFVNVFDELDQAYEKSQTFQHSQSWEKAYLTDFFCELLKRQYLIHCNLHGKQWFEVDTLQDYNNLLRRQSRKISHVEFKKMLGARILSEANDLKRTIEALAIDLKFDQHWLSQVLEGHHEVRDINRVIEKMADCYAIDKSDLYLIENDWDHGMKIMRAEESRASSRIFNRRNKSGGLSPYYEYRDTAMSRLSPFKPEWIKELRVVEDSDPSNPDVAYNNGHFMHQMTLFIGPVNFYWEVNGEKFCEEMNTGDSNYITPYWPHSFTSRNPDETALIIAVTFGGDVRRAQKEFYALGSKSKNYALDYRKPNKAMTQLIRQHMENENISIENFKERTSSHSIELDVDRVFDENVEKTSEELENIAQLLNIELSDLAIPYYEHEEEVVIRHQSEEDRYFYPSSENKLYEISSLARTSKMPLMKGFDFKILTSTTQMESPLSSSLHSYIYNYGSTDIEICWEEEGCRYTEVIHPSDSVYLQPFIRHAFARLNPEAYLFIARVSGSINLTTQKELSYFPNIERVFSEDRCWFE